MPYVITYVPAKGAELSLTQVLFSEQNENAMKKHRMYPGTITRFYDVVPDGLYSSETLQRLTRKLKNTSKYKLQFKDNIQEEYVIYHIPKRDGGMRTICSPNQSLYKKQVALRNVFQDDFFALWHSSAFAYCKNRNIKNCISRHQANKSNWFLKVDFEDFFGSINKAFVLRQLSKIAPFSEIMKVEDGYNLLSESIDICFLNNGLPQGTPISPMLTNLIMIPLDYRINKMLHEKGFVYTRYADDIIVSHKNKFNFNEILKLIKEVIEFEEAPFKIKESKTRYCSKNGKNWNLGLMLNKDNDITIGHRQHKIMKARIHNFIMDEKSGLHWSRDEIQELAGHLAYFESIEPEYSKTILFRSNKKHKVNVNKMISKRLTNI